MEASLAQFKAVVRSGLAQAKLESAADLHRLPRVQQALGDRTPTPANFAAALKEAILDTARLLPRQDRSRFHKVREGRSRMVDSAQAWRSSIFGTEGGAKTLQRRENDLLAAAFRCLCSVDTPDDDAAATVEPSLPIGRQRLPRTQLVEACTKDRTYVERMVFVFEAAEPRPDPPEWDVLEGAYLAELRTTSHGPFNDDPIADLVSVVTDRPERQTDGPTVVRCGVAPSSYYRFAVMSNRLDDPQVATRLGTTETLRQHWRSVSPHFFDDLSRSVPAPARIATVTVMVSTPDDAVVVLVRNPGLHEVAGRDDRGRRSVHFFGEGALASDLDDAGRFAPEVTARRCLSTDEFVPDGPGWADRLKNLIPTGVIFDVGRWQPVFCFLALVDEPLGVIEQGVRRVENAMVVSRPWDVGSDATVGLLMGDDQDYYLASNHAEAALLFALYYRHGREAVDGILASLGT